MSDNLLKSTSTVGGMTFLSRILGFVRDMLAASLFGASAGYDAFLVAFKIPNFLRSLFAEGAFSQAFVPLLAEQQSQGDAAKVKNFIDKVAGCLASVCLLATVLGMLTAPWLIQLFAPGFIADASRQQLAVQLLRITFPYLFFITMTGLAAGILNTYGRYAPPAFTPVLLNVAMITTAIAAGAYFQQPVTALAWGVFLGGLLQLLFQLPFLRSLQLLPRPRLDFSDPKVRRLLKLMLPALVGVSIVQINLLMSTVFASFLPVGSLSWLYYAERLMQLPLGVFGVAIATVVLPHLSRGFAARNNQQFSATLNWACSVALLITLPAALGLHLLAVPLISTLFQYGHFFAADVLQAAAALKLYALGIMAFIAIKVLAAAFYARQDIKTPVKMAAVSLLVNMTVAAVCLHSLAHVGIAVASVVAASINVLGLAVILIRRRVFTLQRQLKITFCRVTLAVALMAVFLCLCAGDEAFWLSAPVMEKVMRLSLLLLMAKFIYFSALWLQGCRLQQLRFEVQ